MRVMKRNGTTQLFDKNKIVVAIEKAMHSPDGHYVSDQATQIADKIMFLVQGTTPTIQQIESLVYNCLIEAGNIRTAKAYEAYRAVQEYKRKINTTDDKILGLLNHTDDELLNENSNKNAILISTQRDLIAGEISKDLVKRKILPADIIEAHESGAIHYHDMDYAIQPSFNCCIVNLEDILNNGTVINGKSIDSPNSFQVACTVTTQVCAAVSSSQFGGQSINGFDRILAPFVRKSFNKYLKVALEEQKEIYGMEPDIDKATQVAKARTKKEIRDGIQTIQYQVNTLFTSNGQSPFVTLLLHFPTDYEYAEEAAMITEEIFKQRIQGIKNEDGVYITPAFP